ncbi:MAG: hypothetical protein KAG66_25105, partial [Methylococcales bacterium]|nr:hypothetical protein [Methylococcales bacterium]
MGDVDTTTFTASYALTAADIDNGGVENSAVATGIPPALPNGTVPPPDDRCVGHRYRSRWRSDS